jgi:hypothetical protein
MPKAQEKRLETLSGAQLLNLVKRQRTRIQTQATIIAKADKSLGARLKDLSDTMKERDDGLTR